MESDDSGQPRKKVRVGASHRITIPQQFRKRHEIDEGDFVYITPVRCSDHEEASEETLEEVRELIKKGYGFTPEF